MQMFGKKFSILLSVTFEVQIIIESKFEVCLLSN